MEVVEPIKITGKPILECDVPEDGNEYEAILYKILVLHTNKFYIGYHVGTVNDGYWHSSKCPEFAKEFAKGNNQIFVLAVGTKLDMIYKERRMLDELNARTNEDCYNLTAGGAAGLVGYTTNAKRMAELTRLIQESVQPNSNGEFERKMVLKESVHAYEHYQTRRFKIIASHSRDLRYAMDDLFGDLSSWDAIVVLQDFPTKGVNTVFGGNHTDDAAYNSKHVVEVPVVYIPNEYVKGFSEFELDTLSKRLNPLPKKKTLSTQDEEVIDWLKKNLRDNGVPINAQSNRDELHDFWNISHQKITALFAKTEKELDTEREVPEGYVWIDWNTDERKLLKETIVEDYRDRNTMAVDIAAGMPKPGDVFETVYALRQKNKTHLVICVTYGSPKIKKAWSNGGSKRFTDMIEYFLDKNAVHKIKVQFVDLDTMERTASLTAH